MTEKLKALRSGDMFDFMGEPNPKCPHCGSTYNVEEQEAWFLLDENEPQEIECVSCYLPFLVSSAATWAFSTYEQEEDE